MSKVKIICGLSLSLLIIAGTYNLQAQQKRKPTPEEEEIIKKLIEKKIPKPLNGKMDKLFISDSSPIGMTTDEFEKDWKPFFKWLEKNKRNGARYDIVNNPNKLTFFGIEVWEANIRFEENKLKRIDVSFYNHGDAQASVRVSSDGSKERTRLNPSQFKKLLKDSNSKITDWIKTKGKSLPARKLVGSKKDYIYEKYWVSGLKCAGLQWSITKLGKSFEPAYMKFVFTKFDPKNDPRRISTRERNTGKLSKAKNIKDNVVKKDDGFTFIDNIPMVDQGSKPYCAVATLERILKYYGSNSDQHQIAQLVDCSAGTDPVKMLNMMRKAAPKLGIQVRSYLDPPDFSGSVRDCKDYIREIEGFNKILKKENMGGVPIEYPIIASCYGAKLDLFREYKCKKRGVYYRKFLRNIETNINAGIPIAWGLFLGYVPESGKTPQGSGGHMRLIIGYNKDKSKLVFTDSWGAGSEYKTINSEDAWIVTSFYGVFRPSNKR